MTTLYLVRHGETMENTAHILQGHMPGNLTELGIYQVEILRNEIKSIQFKTLICSDLKRCIDTASILNKTWNLPIQTTPLLRERDWGSFTGKYIPDIQNIPFPIDVESIEALHQRAHSFLTYIRTHFPNQYVLAIGHGLINRTIQAVYYNKTIHEIEKMGNATYRILEL